jgi:hypothetical protein
MLFCCTTPATRRSESSGGPTITGSFLTLWEDTATDSSILVGLIAEYTKLS